MQLQLGPAVLCTVSPAQILDQQIWGFYCAEYCVKKKLIWKRKKMVVKCNSNLGLAMLGLEKLL